MRALPLLLALSACAPVTRIGDKIIGLTNPVLVGGLVLGTRPPADPTLRAALEANGVMDFTEVRLVVADALELRDIDQALVDGAGLTIRTPDAWPLGVGDDGWYALEGIDAPPYAPGGVWEISADLPDRVLPGSVRVPLPQAADLDFDPVRNPGEDLVIDLSGQGFDYAFAAVYDWRGDELYTSAPLDNDAIVDFVLPRAEPLDRVVIPGSAFPQDDFYIVGIAGMQRAPVEGVVGLNEALTAVFAGRLELFPVVAGSRLGATALFLDGGEPDPTIAALIAGAGIEAGGFVEAFVADLLSLGAPVEGADLQLDGSPLVELGDGRYRLGDVDLAPGARHVLRVITPIAPQGVLDPVFTPPPTPGVPSTGVFGQGLTVTMPGGPYQAGFGLVVGADGLTWSNVPETADAWRFVLGRDGGVDAFRIPASAFPAPGTYAIGVAPITSHPDGVSALSPAFSAALTGELTWSQVLVTP